MKKKILVLMIAIIISKASAFAKDIVLSYYYGASEISDAYLISLTIPIIIFGILGTSIATGYIPIYNEIVKEHGSGKGVRFTNNLINLTLVSCTVLVLLVLIFTKPVIQLFASGFSGQSIETAIIFTRISIIGIYFIGTFYIFESFLHQNGNFSASGLMALPVNLLTIAVIIISANTDKLVLSVGSLLAVVLHTVALVFFSYRKQYRYQFVLDIHDDYLREMILLVLPIILGSSTYQINQIIERTIASQIAVGGITTLSYAQKLVNSLKEVFVISFVTVLYPNMSKMAAKNDMDDFRKAVTNAVQSICLLVVPASMGIMVFSKPIVEMLFLRGAFDAQAVTMTSDALFFYSLGMTALGIRSIFVKASYALQDSKTPVTNSVIGIGVNILLNLLLGNYLGIGGLALASSISATLTMILLYTGLRKKIGLMETGKLLVVFLKILLFSIGMGLTAKLSFEIIKMRFDQNFSFFISVCIGVVLYITAISHAKIDMVDAMKKVFLEKVNHLLDKIRSNRIQ